MRTSIIIDDELAAEARALGINMSEAARDGLRRAVRRRRAELDRDLHRPRHLEDARSGEPVEGENVPGEPAATRRPCPTPSMIACSAS
jgi:Arc/MetJ family transcription regulator